MKKLLTAIAAALVFAGSAFAVDFNVDGNFTVPMMAASYKGDNTGDSYFDTAIGFDFGAEAMVSKQFGLRVAFGLDFPQTHKGESYLTAFGSKITSSYDEQYSDLYNNGITAMSLFVAPVINVKQTKAYTIGVNPGMIFKFYNASTKAGDTVTKYNWTDMGFGAEIDARYTVAKNIYARFSCPVGWLFSMQNSSGETSKYQGFYFAPHFGIGYKL